MKEIGVLKINWELEFWKLVLKIGILKIIWELESWKLNLRIGVSENYLKMKIWKLNLRIGILKNYLKTKVLKIKFKNELRGWHVAWGVILEGVHAWPNTSTYILHTISNSN